jgi:hypothetical protein
MELMLRVKKVNRRRYLYAGEIKVCKVSIEVMLITSLILLILFLTAVSRKHHHQKELKNHNERITHIWSKISCHFEDTC